MSHHLIGRRIEIRPAYNSETGIQDIWDEVAGCQAVIRSITRDGDAIVDIKNGDEGVQIAWSRVRPDPDF